MVEFVTAQSHLVGFEIYCGVAGVLTACFQLEGLFVFAVLHIGSYEFSNILTGRNSDGRHQCAVLHCLRSIGLGIVQSGVAHGVDLHLVVGVLCFGECERCSIYSTLSEFYWLCGVVHIVSLILVATGTSHGFPFHNDALTSVGIDLRTEGQFWVCELAVGNRANELLFCETVFCT